MVNISPMKEKIDTELICSTANALKNLNRQMMNDFETLKSTISELSVFWQGKAATDSIEKFDKIKELSEKRFNVMNGYADFLLKIGGSHEADENKNQSLADQFK